MSSHSIPREAASRRMVNMILVVVSFVCIYIELSIYSGGQLVFPNFGAFVVAIASALYNSRLVRRGHVFNLLALFAVAAFVTFTANVQHGYPLMENAGSLLQLVVALMTGYGIFLALINVGRRGVASIFGFIAITLLVLAVLERIDAVRAFSDSVRNLLYSSNVLYESDRRDILSYGAIRPKVFASEPSLVGVNVGLALAVASLAAVGMKVWLRIAIVTGGLVISLWAVRSPAVVFFVSITFCGFFMLPMTKLYTRFSERAVCLAAMAFVLFSGAIALSLAQRSGGALAEFVHSGSVYMRTIAPPHVAYAVVTQNPWFGVGVGGYDTSFVTVRNVFASQGAFSYFPFLQGETDARFLISNAFWEIPMFFGLLGLAAMLFLFRRLLLSLGLTSTLFPLVAFSFAMQTFGGATAFRPWFFLFIFTAVAYLVQRDSVAPAKPALQGRRPFPVRGSDSLAAS